MIKRGLLVIFLILISITIVKAVTVDKEIYIEKGEIVSVDGKVITLVGISGGKLLVEVDGKTGVVEYGETFNGVNFKFIESFGNAINMNVSINFTCGNGDCGDNESPEVCCKDCECGYGFECVENQCVEEGVECTEDEDCDDEIDCTTNKCDANVCVYESIIDCLDDDSCCPSICTIDSDNDCVLCGGSQCELNGTCYDVGVINNGTYCFNTDWFDVKELGTHCDSDYECLSGICNENCVEEVVNQEPIENDTGTEKLLERKDLGDYFYYVAGGLAVIIIIAVILLKWPNKPEGFKFAKSNEPKSL